MKEYNGIIFVDFSEKCYCVYQLTSTVNDNHIYIGVSGDIIGRWKQHANTGKYLAKNRNPELYNWIKTTTDAGEKIKLIVISSNLLKEEAFELEIKLIKSAKLSGLNVLNKTDGGQGQRGCTLTVESKNKISIARLAVTINPNCKKVYVKNIQTKEILEFDSAVNCSKTLLVSYATVTTKCNTANLKPYKKKYIFSYNKLT
jgi:hypothetical protein